MVLAEDWEKMGRMEHFKRAEMNRIHSGAEALSALLRLIVVFLESSCLLGSACAIAT